MERKNQTLAKGKVPLPPQRFPSCQYRAAAVTWPSLPSDTDSTPVTAPGAQAEMTNHREYVSTQSTGLETDSWCANSTTDSLACEIIPRRF